MYLGKPAIYLANVGANSAHPFISPLYPDGTFEFVPIPEGSHKHDLRNTALPPLPTYSDLRCYHSDRPLLDIFPPNVAAKYVDALVHYDPTLNNHNDDDLRGYTYGDIPFTSVRASSLRSCMPGDAILFLARVTPVFGSKVRSKDATFALVGYLTVQSVFERRPFQDVLLDRDNGSTVPIDTLAQNAHVRQVDSLPQKYAGEHFIIFVGGPKSRRLDRAFVLTQAVIEACFRDATGLPFDFRRFPSLNACIGSYTRTVRPCFRTALPDEMERLRSLLMMIGESARWDILGGESDGS